MFLILISSFLLHRLSFLLFSSFEIIPISLFLCTRRNLIFSCFLKFLSWCTHTASTELLQFIYPDFILFPFVRFSFVFTRSCNYYFLVFSRFLFIIGILPSFYTSVIATIRFSKPLYNLFPLIARILRHVTFVIET